MYNNNCEQAFDDFLDRREYDQAKNELSAIVRIVFLTGCCWWGKHLHLRKVFRLVHKEISELHETQRAVKPTILPGFDRSPCHAVLP